jgi:hypothetical protein
MERQIAVRAFVIRHLKFFRHSDLGFRACIQNSFSERGCVEDQPQHATLFNGFLSHSRAAAGLRHSRAPSAI